LVKDAMVDPRILLLLAGQPPSGEPSPWPQLVLMGLIFAVFYFILILPMRQKQRKLDQLISNLKTGDHVIVSPGIFGTIVGVEAESFQVKIDDKTKIRVLRSAVAGLQGSPSQKTEK
jgi:preprotein translocase subunit YajC